MKKIFSILAFLLVFANLTFAQVPINRIVEHFTNTKCSICAGRNPGLNSNLNQHPDVTRISIHPSSPYAACLLSQQNTIDNDARTNYYGVYGGTPRIVINGSVISGSANYADTSIFTPFAGLSAFTVNSSQIKYANDSIKSIVVVKRVASIAPFGTASLFVGLVEDTINYTGSNGEPVHYNVLRRSVFAQQGIVINLPAVVGDSIVLEGTKTASSFWNFSRMKTVAILQNTSTKQLIQSGISTTASSSVSTGLNSLKDQIKIGIYPNPANDQITVKFPANEKVNFKIYNAIGNEVVSGQITGTEVINLNDLRTGVYFFIANTGNKKYSQRFIVKK